MKPSRPVGLALGAGLILAATLAAIVGGRSYSSHEEAAAPETLQQIARKNDAAAANAALHMEARAEAATAAKESAERQDTVAGGR